MASFFTTSVDVSTDDSSAVLLSWHSEDVSRSRLSY